MMKRCHILAFLLLGLTVVVSDLYAEPYLGVRSGRDCSGCHVNPTGGGMRNTGGVNYGKKTLSRRLIETNDAVDEWAGEINKWLAIGGDFRGEFSYTDTPNQSSENEFGIVRGTIYLDVKLIPSLLSLYIDEQIAPGSAINREAYALFTPQEGKFWVKAGQFFLPYGLRLEDDSAFIRQFTGINFNTPDKGVEVGLDIDSWLAALSITNGSGGGAETDSGKQVSLLGSFVRSKWQIGASINFNDSDAGDRQMQNIFLGLKTGPIAWLAEVDLIQDEGTPTGDRDSFVGLVEANWLATKGNNIKLTYEYFDPDNDISDNEQNRYSLIWEYMPIQYVQGRVGVRRYDGIDQDDLQNRDEAFAQLHVYF
jgi:hypothetical protein